MRFLSPGMIRSCAGACMALGAQLAQAHEGHGAFGYHGHPAVWDRLLDSAIAWVGSAAPDTALLGVVAFGAWLFVGWALVPTKDDRRLPVGTSAHPERSESH